ncbi:DNA-binding response regulator, OmpR family, contains REC and winged-helix (wHTH) domain [Desulfatibacillum alkenivorans DSM 16219]|jgi:DNA-binding response OmpR family regulator|uniref:DNA-binding response regulator, OmpR family, contains REC and winged-helix (WHTH) domain n=1 Tax=Desulfatibacillum alkenivorans DSM 16219 TaxID=1121393 RepID=A0A1M6PF48_9BACT|nr:response regulator transcription factor [Desulfatibacillum alkenivorans]SHK06566.1 DNA-binding response regulator, OmpR family, contains REC and winged-helix (wHTH) domain [Desulfatibacillum alkenivorans DSM 16219]
MRILIVDDEPDLLEQISQVLQEQKYESDTAPDGEDALDRIFEIPYDLILLDIMLPKIDGMSVLREIRQAGIKTPVLMLTAKGKVEDRIKGLDRGADDYLAKPFSVAELLARIRALLRRSTENAVPNLEAGEISLNTVTREVKVDEATVGLTPKEFSILEFLLYNKNRAVSRFSLAEHVWGEDFDPFTMSNYIDVHVKNLRKKIGDGHGELVKTLRGVGYIIKDVDS